MPEKTDRMRLFTLLSTTGVMLGLFLLLVISSGCTQNTGMSDSTGMKKTAEGIVFNDTMSNRVVLSHPAEHIAVMGRAITEMLIAIGASDKIVGIDTDTKQRKDLVANLHPDVKTIGSDPHRYRGHCPVETRCHGYICLEQTSECRQVVDGELHGCVFHVSAAEDPQR